MVASTRRSPVDATGPFGRAAAAIRSLGGWKRLAAALALGVVATFALAPYGVWPLFPVAFSGLVWLLDGVAARPAASGRLAGAFAVGFAFGFGYLAASLYWVGEAFLVDADAYAWMLPFAVTGLPAMLAPFFGAGTALAMLLWQKGPLRILALAFGLTVGEWLRGHVLFGGFPWNLPGYGAAEIAALAQSAAWIGIYGLTFLVVLWSAWPALLAERPRRAAWYAVAAVALGSLIVALAAGEWRLAGPSPAAGPLVRIVQPSIPQALKWDQAQAQRVFDLLLSLSATPQGGEMPALVVWPESAVPFLIDESGPALSAVADLLPEGSTLVLGALRRAEPPQSDGRRAVYNSVMAIDANGVPVARYDKRRLVPFGEYLPLAGLLEPLGLRQVVQVPAGFSAGSGDAVMRVSGLADFLPLVCYEAIFPQRVPLPVVASGRGFVLNVTNDAWFGESIGPPQHLAHARLRAIETGLPLVRAANSGISAIVDPYGNLVARLALGRRGTIEARLPDAAGPTLHARVGDLGLVAMLFATLAAILAVKCRGWRRGRPGHLAFALRNLC